MNDIPTFVWTVALNALDILLRIAGILAVVLLIVNGYQYLMSAGAPEKISKAKTGLLQAIVGLAIALLASTIIYYIVGGIT
jgi:type IV secretory pathway VirB2 component (pilin)